MVETFLGQIWKPNSCGVKETICQWESFKQPHWSSEKIFTQLIALTDKKRPTRSSGFMSKMSGL